MRRLRLAFGFFTVLPLAGSGSMREIAAAGFLLPVVAVALGGIEGLAAWGLTLAYGAQVTAALVLALALLLTGLHHADGLADVGDAVMARGGRTRRRAVLKDRATGAGAVTTLIMVYLVSWAALSQAIGIQIPSDLPWMLIAVEVSARLSLILVAALSRPSHPGSGSAFIESLGGGRGLAALLLSALALAALAWPLGTWLPFACWVAASLTALLLAAGGLKWFGGANGDLLGASVELGRAAALLAVAAVLLHP